MYERLLSLKKRVSQPNLIRTANDLKAALPVRCVDPMMATSSMKSLPCAEAYRTLLVAKLPCLWDAQIREHRSLRQRHLLLQMHSKSF